MAGMHAVKGSRRVQPRYKVGYPPVEGVCGGGVCVCVCVCVCVEGVYVCEYTDSSPACMHSKIMQIMSHK